MYKYVKASIEDRRADIQRRREAFESEYNQKQAAYDEKDKQYRKARYDAFQSIADDIRRYSNLDSFSTLGGVEITIDSTFDDDGLEVRIRDDNDKFNSNKALSWDFRVRLDKNGNVEKDSGSWSGMKAVNPENIQNLKEIAEFLGRINDLDWKVILKQSYPKYVDYMKDVQNPQWSMKRPNFEREELEADIDELIGQNKAVLGKNYDGSFYVGGKVYYKLVSASPSQYTVSFLPQSFNIPTTPENAYRKRKEIEDLKYTKRISKDKFMSLIDKPLNIIDIKE